MQFVIDAYIVNTIAHTLAMAFQESDPVSENCCPNKRFSRFPGNNFKLPLCNKKSGDERMSAKLVSQRKFDFKVQIISEWSWSYKCV